MLFFLSLLSLPAISATTWEGFLDTYYAYDFNAPASKKRAYTTQPVRHNEPNINLAFGGVKVEQDKYRGRFALQGGNSVEANTIFETNSLRYIQEAYAGMKAGDTWIDAGVYLGNIGAESWISRDNWTYSRALNLDYVPYYSAGVRISHKNFQLHLMNGWQNIREDNKAKAIGMQYVQGHFTYNNFFGDEEVVSNRPRFRGYHNFIWKNDVLIGAVDVGHQTQQENSGTDIWWAASFTARKVLSETKAMAARIEHYSDPHQANVLTGTRGGFVTSSMSVNFDQALSKKVLWRNELRGFSSRDRIFPEGSQKKNRLDGFFVSSLALTL